MAIKIDKLTKKLEQFQNIWYTGYFAGYFIKKNQKGLEGYIKNNLDGSTLLEVSCCGGQWAKFIYNLNIFNKEIRIASLSTEHNKFWVNLDKKI